MTDDLVPRFARIPAGDFTMGTDDGDEDERPPHRCHVSAFSLSVHAITHQQYAAFVRATGHRPPAVSPLPLVVAEDQEQAFRDLAAPYVWRDGEPPRERLTHPVTLVTHADALAFCAWLSSTLGQPIRLPTEAEWERAARGGLEACRYPWGDDIDPSRANFLIDPSLKRYRGTRPVGSFAPNGFGLYEMCGNVWEWVSDWYDAEAYGQGDRRDPAGPSEGTLRVLRGGSWVTPDVAQLRCAHRHKVPPDTFAYSIGFRVATDTSSGV